MVKKLMRFMAQRYLYIGAVLGVAAAWYLLLPSTPRASYLAAGCSTTTTGTIAVTLGGIFSVLVKLVTLAGGGAAGAWVLWVLAFICDVVRSQVQAARVRRAQKASGEQQPTPKPRKIKPVLTSGAKYAHYFPHTGPGFFTRKWLDWHRAYFSTDAQVVGVLTVVIGTCFLFLTVYVKPYVCTETAGQWFAFAITMLTLDIAVTAAASWLWLDLSPRDKALEARNKRYGNLRHFIEGRLSAPQVLAFAVRYLHHCGTYYRYEEPANTIDKAAERFAVQAVGGNKEAVSTAWLSTNNDKSLIFVLLALHTTTDEHITFYAELEAGRLTAGRTAKGTRVIERGVRLRIPETTSIEHLLHGVFSIFADQIKADPEAQAALREIAARPAPAPSPAGKRKKK